MGVILCYLDLQVRPGQSYAHAHARARARDDLCFTPNCSYIIYRRMSELGCEFVVQQVAELL